jgi:tetrahydromethanopterin S-methyltransferase subunit A
MWHRGWICGTIEQTMTETTRRVTQWIIGVRGAVPLVEELATAEDVQSFVRGHVRWVDGTAGLAIKLEDIDWTTVDWNFVLKVMHAVL